MNKDNLNDNLIEIKNLKKYFPVGKKRSLKAVDDVTFDIRRGETFGLVGESGCGKTTCGRTIVGIYKPTGGEVHFDGQEVHSLSGKDKLKFKKRAQVIFQDPYASLDPRMTVGDIIGEGMDVHFDYTEAERLENINNLLSIVGLNHEHGSRFAHELSGGQRQRIGIARALSTRPKFLVCDEPVSALDVSVQSQILNLTMDLQEEFGLSYLFIAHDLNVIKHVSHKVAVMYLGKIVEKGQVDTIFKNPLHPYTRALISAPPSLDLDGKDERIRLQGEMPSAMNIPKGCSFQNRCPESMGICRIKESELLNFKGDRQVSCHLYNEVKTIE